jgi:hypothetical protein
MLGWYVGTWVSVVEGYDYMHAGAWARIAVVTRNGDRNGAWARIAAVTRNGDRSSSRGNCELGNVLPPSGP